MILIRIPFAAPLGAAGLDCAGLRLGFALE
jgi:hypothetical protein